MTPSWLSLGDIVVNRVDVRVLGDWWQATWLKLLLATQSINKSRLAEMGTELVDLPEQRAAEPALWRWLDEHAHQLCAGCVSGAPWLRRIDPASVAEYIWAYGLGFARLEVTLLSPESSAVINSRFVHLGAKIQPVERDAATASSESTTKVSTTTTAGKKPITAGQGSVHSTDIALHFLYRLFIELRLAPGEPWG